MIYVGKAKDLRARVRAYFNSADERSQIQFLVRRVEDIETLVTSNDKEALILENNLIKQYKPRYNIRLKDDKSYLSIKVTTAACLAAHFRDAQDRQGRQPLLRAVLVGAWRRARPSTSSKSIFRCATAPTTTSATAAGLACSIRSSAAWAPCVLPVAAPKLPRAGAPGDAVHRGQAAGTAEPS